jgi:hypothetical protein
MSGLRSDMSGLGRICPVWEPDMSGLGAGYVRLLETSRSEKVDRESRRCV